VSDPFQYNPAIVKRNKEGTGLIENLKASNPQLSRKSLSPEKPSGAKMDQLERREEFPRAVGSYSPQARMPSTIGASPLKKTGGLYKD
jgi:hypothetical protein